MAILGSIAGLVLVGTILWEAFEALVLPRRVTRPFRLNRVFYRVLWGAWSSVALRLHPGARREAYLSVFGPLSLIGLFAVWATGLILGFGLVLWASGPSLNVPRGPAGFSTALYMSGTTFFTLGLGDVTPNHALARLIVVIEAGTGFGFLALVIAYLPILYQAFSRRETNISLLDSRAGSPPSAAELLRRHAGDMEGLDALLRNWERWSAELMESHVSYPVLGYYRSQHDNQSWLAALTTVLDASALIIAGFEPAPARQARLTFAMARHAVVDLAQVFRMPPRRPDADRLTRSDFGRLRASLAQAGIHLNSGDAVERALSDLRALYEPYVHALARRLLMPLPAWTAAGAAADNWRTSAWGDSDGVSHAETGDAGFRSERPSGRSGPE
jgi:hypothetical protein